MRRRFFVKVASGYAGSYTISAGYNKSSEVVDYLFDKYGVAGSVYSPIAIDEEIYLEGYGDYTGLNGKATHARIVKSDSLWLYTEESMKRYFAASLTALSNEDGWGELLASQAFYD